MQAKTHPRRSIRELLAGKNKSKVARALTASGFRVNPSTVSRWANGERIPSGPALQALAGYLEVPEAVIALDRQVAA